MLHLSRGVFGADFGSVSAVIKNAENLNAKGTYFKLIDRTFQEFEPNHLKLLLEKALFNHDFKFSFADYSKDVNDICYSDDGLTIYYPDVLQENFKKIPGHLFGYWLSKSIIKCFEEKTLANYSQPKKGMDSPPNDYYLKLWFEINVACFRTNCHSAEEFLNFESKWAPITKGGEFRKWFGNNDYVIRWENNGAEVHANPRANIRNERFYFSESLTWSDLSSGAPSFRYNGWGFLPNVAGPCIYDFKVDYRYLIALLNSNTISHILKITAPTWHFNVGAIASLPFINAPSKEKIIELSDYCIQTSKADWDAHETSWDFKSNEIVDSAKGNDKIKDIAIAYITRWFEKFLQLHENEEELNRQFIEIYGLQDELSPDVPLDEVTILQQGEVSIEPFQGDTWPKEPIPGHHSYFSDNNKIRFVTCPQLTWHIDIFMKQLISYAVGCWMGRYRLDKPGLHIAHPDATPEEIAPYEFNGEPFIIDDDGIIPLMPRDSRFNDNAALRFNDFVRLVFGERTLVENLNFIEQKLGKSLEQYFIKDFWKDHKKMYLNRPIYWLFSSKKGAFQCLAYMHRMNKYTPDRIRQKYLLPHMEDLRNRIAELDERAASLNTQEKKTLESLQSQLKECTEYHDRLHPIAEQLIDFDLDDGVVVNYTKFGDVLAKLK